jgi:hypothetical protein
MLVTVLLCVAVIVTGATLGKPSGWVVLGLGVLALLAQVGARVLLH